MVKFGLRQTSKDSAPRLKFHRDNLKRDAPVAQLDRVNASEALGHKFESCRAHHYLLAALGHKLPATIGYFETTTMPLVP